jgi:hypothetical protein
MNGCNKCGGLTCVCGLGGTGATLDELLVTLRQAARKLKPEQRLSFERCLAIAKRPVGMLENGART